MARIELAAYGVQRGACSPWAAPTIACHSFFISCKPTYSYLKLLQNPAATSQGVATLLRHCGVCEVQNQGNADRRAVSACLTGLIGSPSPQVPQQYTVLLFGMGIVHTTKRLKSGAEVPDFQAKHDRPVKVMSKNVQIIMRNGQKCGITRNELWFHQNMTAICQLQISNTKSSRFKMLPNIIV